jgi:hypothetical protein
MPQTRWVCLDGLKHEIVTFPQSGVGVCEARRADLYSPEHESAITSQIRVNQAFRITFDRLEHERTIFSQGWIGVHQTLWVDVHSLKHEITIARQGSNGRPEAIWVDLDGLQHEITIVHGSNTGLTRTCMIL